MLQLVILLTRFFQTILLIAEAYYRKGEFEEALVFFANGRHLRPSIAEFQKGIYKCEAAIENNCGDDCDIQLAPDIDLTDYYLHAFPVSQLAILFREKISFCLERSYIE